MPQAVDDDYVYGICTFTEMRMRERERDENTIEKTISYRFCNFRCKTLP